MLSQKYYILLNLFARLEIFINKLKEKNLIAGKYNNKIIIIYQKLKIF